MHERGVNKTLLPLTNRWRSVFALLSAGAHRGHTPSIQRLDAQQKVVYPYLIGNGWNSAQLKHDESTERVHCFPRCWVHAMPRQFLELGWPAQGCPRCNRWNAKFELKARNCS